MRDVVLLGSTGSIGTQTLEVIDGHRDRFRVVGLSSGGGNLDALIAQAHDFTPDVVAVPTPAAAATLAGRLPAQTAVWSGPDASSRLAAQPCDVVLNAITGAAGLEPTLAALRAGNALALANKESLVIGGELVTAAAAPGQLIAVDSEHSAFAQALRAGRADEVGRLVLTASGGPFRGRRRDELVDVTPEQALAHPTWTMGRIITINSATLVNKGLELLEAHLLYGVDLDAIQVVVHPTSAVHSMVEFCDGSTIAQCSPPDMKLPIALALNWPERLPGAVRGFDWSRPIDWHFEPLDADAFPAVELARRCGHAGGTAPAVYNAANEVCVDAFCDGRLGFTGIVDTVAAVVEEHLASSPPAALSVETVLAADAWGRARAGELVGELV
ncbi:1-deoxy-D-xylulose-5-phosphate reductoisomerase [Micropruina sonneratiae]|uniref:1-deoxy-D-xylulose-5-phosphate reductoisomerase n=1 Tax=Micropruina sonneratiae TaxID=2986940 RepID=UPI002227DD19|nr:1-deoxy-D-xylulose-5-phosphate reductoisomerase [Micropruina sp. KQZ13P-5]MCW3157243.1 1-deoxy-D-xylulose-5-phosphate reductoisomerase [Micropruina sp. KQZ13P-5]